MAEDPLNIRRDLEWIRIDLEREKLGNSGYSQDEERTYESHQDS